MVDEVIETIGFTIDGAEGTVLVGDVTTKVDGVEVHFRMESDESIPYRAVIEDPETGDVIASEQSFTGIGVGTKVSVLAPSPPDTFDVVIEVPETDGVEVGRVTLEVDGTFRAENIVTTVEELSEGPYDQRPWEADDPSLLEYRVEIRNDNPPQLPGVEFRVEYPVRANAASGGQRRDSREVSLSGGESVEFNVLYGEDATSDWLRGDGFCIRLRDFTVSTGEDLDWGDDVCLDVSFRPAIMPGDVSIGGSLNWRPGFVEGGPGYEGPGGELSRTSRVNIDSLAARDASADLLYVERLVNVEAGESVQIREILLEDASRGDGFNDLGGNRFEWPVAWDDPFTLRHEREVYILTGPYADEDNPVAVATETQQMIEEDDDADDGVDDPEPDPDPDPVEPSVDAACDFDGAEINVGGSVTIPVDVTAGDGDMDTEATVEIEVAGQTASETVTVEPNGSARVEATYEITEPGEYTPTITLS